MSARYDMQTYKNMAESHLKDIKNIKWHDVCKKLCNFAKSNIKKKGISNNYD